MTYNKEAMNTYYLMHSFCPSCGKDDVERTCVGQWFRDSETFKDENKAMCSCGWVGIVHDLVHAFPPCKTRYVMDATKQEALEAAGWKFGDASDFLGHELI